MYKKYPRSGVIAACCAGMIAVMTASAQGHSYNKTERYLSHDLCLSGPFGRGCLEVTYDDTNNDQRISREEFLAQFSEVFKLLDAEKQGSLPLRTAFMNQVYPPFSMDQRNPARLPNPGEVVIGGSFFAGPVTAPFPIRDKDDDSFLSEEEFLASHIELFSRLDSNNDGRLSLNEVMSITPF